MAILCQALETQKGQDLCSQGLPSGGGEIKKERPAVRFVPLMVGCPQRFQSSRDVMRLLQADPGAGTLPGRGSAPAEDRGPRGQAPTCHQRSRRRKPEWREGTWDVVLPVWDAESVHGSLMRAAQGFQRAKADQSLDYCSSALSRCRGCLRPRLWAGDSSAVLTARSCWPSVLGFPNPLNPVIFTGGFFFFFKETMSNILSVSNF